MTRLEALTALLAIPDEPCMTRRWAYTYARDPRRDPWQIKRNLGIAYVEYRRQAWTNGDISAVVCVRKLRMVKRA
jgi:hypothetical protein